MPSIRLQKRANDFFLSHAHKDRKDVQPVVDLLKSCGMQVWFDSSDGNAALRSSDLLGDAIGNARGAIFCLSDAWMQSEWCRGEYDVSLAEKREVDGFEIVCVRLDGSEAPRWFRAAEIVDLQTRSPAACARLLGSLSSDVPRRFDNDQDVYLAAPWSRPSELAREALDVLQRYGWRLVGDSPHLTHFGERRIASIVETTRAVVALLPHDPTQPASTSPFILQEARIAVELRKPLLLLAEPGVEVPEDLLAGCFCRNPVLLGSGADARGRVSSVIEDFDETIQRTPQDERGAFVFFAASLREDRDDDGQREAEYVATVIERASNMRCVRGERLSADNVQRAIVELIRKAAVVIADVTDDHRNTLIEAGIAMGSGTPLRLLCREPSTGLPKKAFMFEGQEYNWYRTPEQRLALCYYFARQHRRKVYVRR
jgi:hypothetical protein